jgi:hypothetical protein
MIEYLELVLWAEDHGFIYEFDDNCFYAVGDELRVAIQPDALYQQFNGE